MVLQPTIPELRVRAPESLAAMAARVSRLDPDVVRRIMRFVGLDQGGGPIGVVLVTEDSDLARATPRAIAGFARGDESVVVLFPGRSTSYPYDSFEDVVRHEIAHVLIARASGHRFVPRWFHEGVALAAERSWGLEDRTRTAVALSGRRWSARELDEAFADSAGPSAAAYAISGALVRDLLRRHGADTPARILSRMAAGEPFSSAFLAATGDTLGENEDQFWRASWWSEAVPFFTSSLMLWFAVTLLALYALRTRRQRRALQRKAWEEEEPGKRSNRGDDEARDEV
jgi:peptidase MA superfamily protein